MGERGDMPGGILEREFTNRRCERTFGRRTLNGKTSQCVVACVEVRPISSNGSSAPQTVDPGILFGLAVQRVERCLRPDDLICPMGAGRVAVCFGYGAHLTRVASLGTRLATATGEQVSVDSQGLALQVAVGIGRGASPNVLEVAAAAIAACAAGKQIVKRGLLSSNGSSDANNHAGVAPKRSTGVVVAHLAGGGLNLHRREVISPRHDRDARAHDQSASSRPAAPDHERSSDLSVLIVGLDCHEPHRPDPAVEALVAASRRVGVTPRVANEVDPSLVVQRHERSKEEVVVLALGPEHGPYPRVEGQGTPWETWAQLARDLVRAGATVLAVRTGGSVAAIAMCVREGAIGLLDLGEFAEQLEKINVNLAIGRLAAENGNRELPRGLGRGALPNPYNKLVGLTSSEHRVLYQMMRGASASEIAEELIVSLATVRSHIRSILRKLEVSSQLAAVALANGARQESADAI